MTAVRHDLHTRLGDADGDLRDLLIRLADAHHADLDRPCLDADTTLADWVETGHYAVPADDAVPATIGTALYLSYYVSEDYPISGTWSVYSELWDYPDAPEPIDGSQTWISSHPSEQAAAAEAQRLRAASQ